MFRMTFVLRTACVLAMAFAVFAAECRAQSEVMTALYPDPDVYPQFDYEGFIKKLKYPEAARELDIEAEIMIGVLIASDGTIDSVSLVESDCEMPPLPDDKRVHRPTQKLYDNQPPNEQSLIKMEICADFFNEAKRAINNCTFTPAYSNDQPIPFWVRIPIIFKLR